MFFATYNAICANEFTFNIPNMVNCYKEISDVKIIYTGCNRL